MVEYVAAESLGIYFLATAVGCVIGFIIAKYR